MRFDGGRLFRQDLSRAKPLFMKTIALLASALLLIGLAPAPAQEIEIETVQREAGAAKPRDAKLQQEQRANAALQKKPDTYSGFLVDASRSEKKPRFFSLRQPRDPKNDTRNVAYEERTGRPRGFALFRIEF